jgi:hypothetical protein
MEVRSRPVSVPREKLFQEALQLEQQARVALAKLLIDSLDPTTERDVEGVWMRERDRRTHELDARKAETIPWQTVRARLRASRG